jgi:hypothetical protein
LTGQDVFHKQYAGEAAGEPPVARPGKRYHLARTRLAADPGQGRCGLKSFPIPAPSDQGKPGPPP